MKTCILLAINCIFLLSMGCSNGVIGGPFQDQAWTISNASIVTVYNCRMLPPDSSWEKDVQPSPYPDSTRYIADIFNGQARNPSHHSDRGRELVVPCQFAGRSPEGSPIKLVMRDESNRLGS